MEYLLIYIAVYILDPSYWFTGGIAAYKLRNKKYLIRFGLVLPVVLATNFLVRALIKPSTNMHPDNYLALVVVALVIPLVIRVYKKRTIQNNQKL